MAGNNLPPADPNNPPADPAAATPPALSQETEQLRQAVSELSSGQSMLVEKLDALITGLTDRPAPTNDADRDAGLRQLETDRPELAPVIDLYRRTEQRLAELDSRQMASERQASIDQLTRETHDVLAVYDIPAADLNKCYAWIEDPRNEREADVLHLREVAARVLGTDYLDQHRRAPEPAPNGGGNKPPNRGAPGPRAASIVPDTTPGGGPAPGPPPTHKDLREATDYLNKNFIHTLTK